jgi:hypothetical protein
VLFAVVAMPLPVRARSAVSMWKVGLATVCTPAAAAAAAGTPPTPPFDAFVWQYHPPSAAPTKRIIAATAISTRLPVTSWLLLLLVPVPVSAGAGGVGADVPGLVRAVPPVVLRMVGAVVGGMVVLLASRALRVLVASRLGMCGGGEGLVAVGCTCAVIEELMVVKGVDLAVVVVLWSWWWCSVRTCVAPSYRC